MICDRHAVVVVPFPFHEIAVTKRRPALVISGKEFNAANGWTIIAMITTARKTHWASDVDIVDIEIAGLKTACIVRMRLQTIPNDIIDREIGKLGQLDRKNADRQFAALY